MTGSGGRPTPGWHVLCLHPVASCHREHMGGDIAIRWLFTNNLSPLPTNWDQTGLETKSIYLCFVLFEQCFAMNTHWSIRILQIWCLFISCLHRLFFHNFVTFLALLKLHCVFALRWNFSTLSDLWGRLQKWLIRVLELGRWSCKQIFPFSLCHVFSLTLAVRKQRYTKCWLGVFATVDLNICYGADCKNSIWCRHSYSIFHSRL